MCIFGDGVITALVKVNSLDERDSYATRGSVTSDL